MSLFEDEIESDSDYEVITVNPNINYESDESNEDEENNVRESMIDDTEVIIHKDPAAVDEASCDSIVTGIAPNDDDISMSSIDSKAPVKVRKKLNLQEYKIRRANELDKPLFDLPMKVAAFELCDVPTLPNMIFPTDPNFVMHKNEIKSESPDNRIRKLAFNPILYEEIILVSMACNTEVSIPPFEKPSSNFLTNIVNNLKEQKVGSLLNSSTSLFSSIQAVVQGKCQSTGTDNEPDCVVSTDSKEQGEDKTIMHLRKDRLRPFKCSSAVQTDNDSLFPPLLLSPALIFNRIRNARNYRRKKSLSRSRSRSRSFSPSMEYDRVRYHNSRYSRSQHSTHSSSMNSSSSESDSDSDSSSCSSSQSSGDSLKRFNDRQNFRFYNRNQTDRNCNYKFQGEFKRKYLR